MCFVWAFFFSNIDCFVPVHRFSFAMSAKKVQNKPHVNEVCSDSVFMKRLIREIKRLNEELANTRSSESQRVRDALMERQAQILGPKPEQNTLRRRTWAPSVSGTGTAGGVSADGPSRESRIVAPGYVGTQKRLHGKHKD